MRINQNTSLDSHYLKDLKARLQVFSVVLALKFEVYIPISVYNLHHLCINEWMYVNFYSFLRFSCPSRKMHNFAEMKESIKMLNSSTNARMVKKIKTKIMNVIFVSPAPATAYFLKKVLSVYTHSMTTIYLSLSTQVARSTFFMKSPVFIWYQNR